MCFVFDCFCEFYELKYKISEHPGAKDSKELNFKKRKIMNKIMDKNINETKFLLF